MNPWLWWLNDYEGRNINDGVGAQSNDNNNGDGPTLSKPLKNH